MTSPVLQACGLEAGYGKLAVVRDLDLELHAGAIVALFGANGAGKTTVVRTLSGLLPAIAGDVKLYGESVRTPLHRRARMGLSLVTERRAVVKTLTLAENLRVARADIAEALRMFPELREHMERRAGLLSGGQQQMLSLARALARRPKVLLIDELSLGLAPIIVNRLLEAVRSAADDGMAILLVEQHVGKALKVADHVKVLRHGHVVLDGHPNDFRGRTNEIFHAYMSNQEAIPSPTLNGHPRTQSTTQPS